ncbi:M6 family metalloprotease domain-containing protein [Acetivibrio cellulolyticus]|uniref:M6 family metalloprotease domain-containing protein n=1 Tax=Acetivibrio cellulolyticus TaxID=35830 RepID=UPI0002F93CE1|nr:M6 family metalloprotease domain-containing protein [Acetivibrio cellulolyticus]
MKSHVKSAMVLFGALFIIYFQQMLVVAAPHNGEVYSLKQPDNSYVQVKVYGDEFYQRIESIDGYTLVRDSDTNWICYAEVNKGQNDFVSTGIKYSKDENKEQQVEVKRKLTKGQKLNRKVIENKADKAKRIFFSQGFSQQNNISLCSENNLLQVQQTEEGTKILGLTLLIKFSDKDTDIAKQNVSDMINKVGYDGYGNNGSVRDYFYDVSGGEVIYNNYVTDFYVAKKPKSYYEDTDIEVGVRANELIQEALQDLESKGFDFSILSTNSNKIVLALNVLYAGSPDTGWGKGLWPHSGCLDETFTADDVKISAYQIAPLEKSLNITTYIHENGHMLFGWPDLYDYDSDSKGAGLYSVMSYSYGANPVPPDPYLRSICCGWGKVTTLNDLPDKTTVSVKAGSLEVFKFDGPNPEEYFLIENISKTGRWAKIPDEGLIIWHIDENGSNNWQDMTYEKHYMVSVEQADGEFDLEGNINYGDSSDLFDGSNYTAFNDTTSPSSKLWDGQSSGLNITNISIAGDTMTFTINNSNSSKTTATATPTPIPTATPTPIPTPTQDLSPTPTIIIGDVNGDNSVNSLDFAYTRMYLLGISSAFPSKNGIIAADVNADSSINSIDFAYIRQYLLGYIDKFPAIP